ncbi:hypothetical protein B1987_22790 [Mycobacterium kansasii]|uniref:hypothetical protein n=1 Tax=Mycobacterium attenuatum TaxID=2341086 RepID=UPI000A0ACF47|nr:hypothetical protein [Mycobacterium attenuatum]ORB86123.1 hypothetical protein B1987_22790 [Mycobacterium kansasii]
MELSRFGLPLPPNRNCLRGHGLGPCYQRGTTIIEQLWPLNDRGVVVDREMAVQQQRASYFIEPSFMELSLDQYLGEIVQELVEFCSGLPILVGFFDIGKRIIYFGMSEAKHAGHFWCAPFCFVVLCDQQLDAPCAARIK